MLIKSIPVKLKGRPYSIFIGSGILPSLGPLLIKQKITGTVFVVSQEPVWKACGSSLKAALSASGIGVETFIAPARLESEKLKSHAHFLKILDALIRADRRSKGVAVVALGGGVVGDAAGFAAAIYKRGIPYVQIPTTLTAQVDSSIGGKTAIDLPQGKNLLGAFHQPQFVFSDTQLLNTLPDSVFIDGMAEVVKYGAIRDAKFLTWIETHLSAILKREPAAITKVVSVCARIKATVVAGDERDTRGVRMTLNFGHTLGHALEAAAGYTALSHGRAVSIGMCAAADLSAHLGVLKDRALPGRLRSLLTACGLPVTIPARLKSAKIIEAIFYDKKRLAGKNRFVLIQAAGKTLIHPDVPGPVIEQVVRRLGEKPGAGDRSGSSGRFLGAWFKPGAKQEPVRGTVENYLDRIGVAIIRWDRGVLKKGDQLRIEGPLTALTLEASSLQINRVEVSRVKRGDVFGIKVPSPVRAGDSVR